MVRTISLSPCNRISTDRGETRTMLPVAPGTVLGYGCHKPQPRGSHDDVDQGKEVTATMRSATRELVSFHGSAAVQPVRQSDSKLSQASSSVRTRLLRLSAVGLAVVALALSAVTASATDFSLPEVHI